MNNPFPSLIWTICLQWVTFNFDVPTSIYKINNYTSLYFLILHILHYTFLYFVIILLSSFSLIPLYYLSSYYHFSIMNSSLIYLFLPPSYIISSILSFSPSNILVYDIIWRYIWHCILPLYLISQYMYLYMNLHMTFYMTFLPSFHYL